MPLILMIQGEVNRWRSVFEAHYGLDKNLSETKMTLSYCYGVALRRTHADTAEQYLQELAEILGKNGEFEIQLQTLFEIGLLYQAQGQLAKARNIHHRLAQLLQTYHVIGLPDMVMIQLSRIAIEQQDGTQALAHLEGLSLTKIEVYILYCEARLLNEDADFLKQSIPQLLMQDGLAGKHRASLHTILGRTYQQTEEFTDAIIHFNEALSIVEQESTQFDIARARNNLGSSYLMQLDDLDATMVDELEQMIIETKRLQTQIKDRVGLEASFRNLTYLRQFRTIN